MRRCCRSRITARLLSTFRGREAVVFWRGRHLCGVDGAVRRARRCAAAVGAGELRRRHEADADPSGRRRSHDARAFDSPTRRRHHRCAGGGRPAGDGRAAGSAGARRGQQHTVRLHGRRARLDDVHDQPLPLRPGVVEHAGGLHQPVDRGPARPVPADTRLRSGARASRDGPAGTGIQVRARRGGLPQAILGYPPRGPRGPAPADRRRPARGDGRRLQRAEHQPHQPRDHDSKLRARHGLSARRARCRPGHRVAAGRVRARPAVPRHGRRRGADLQFVGPWPVPPVGPDGRRRRPGAHAVLQRVRVDGSVGPRPADPLHARALLGRLVDGFGAVAGRRPRRPPTACSPS